MNTQLEHIWTIAQEKLSREMAPGNFKTWIEPLKVEVSNEGQLHFIGPNSFFLNWVKNHFAADISLALKAAAQEKDAYFDEASVKFSEAKGAQAKAWGDQAPTSGSEPGRQSDSFAAQTCQSPQMLADLGQAKPLRLNPKFTFDNFVVGNSNLYAYSAAKALADGETLGADSLYITADHGLGKSHLSQAFGQAYLAAKPGSRIYYLTAEDFTNEMVLSIRNNNMESFKSKYRHNCDVLVLEEVHFLAGKEKVQNELGFTLDYILNERGKKVVFTSPQEPKSIPRLGRALRSRLLTSLVSPIGSPDFETRLNILVTKARHIGLRAGRAVLEYLADNISSDVRQLESALAGLKAKSQILNRAADIELARETLAYMFDDSEDSLSPVGVRKIICRHFQVEENDLLSKSRKRNLIQARSLGMFLARRFTTRTLEEIGAAFGRNHSTTIYTINQLEQQLKSDLKLQGKVEFLSQQLLK